MEFIAKIGLAFTQGGIWMWVILLLQIAAMAIVVERFIFLYMKRRIGENKFAMNFESMIRSGQLNQAIELAKSNETKHPLARAVRAGTEAAIGLGGKEEIQGKMDEILLEENSFLDKRTGFLSMLANVGTLTGLLGTIAGMIKSFAAVAFANPMEKATLLSSGISEAMNTTAYGLVMAIPTLILYAIFTNRGTQLAEDLNRGALKIFNWLSYSYEPTTFKDTSSRAKPATQQQLDA